MLSHGLPSELSGLLALGLLTILGDGDDDPEDRSRDPGSQIGWLRSLYDREALFQIMDRDRQLTQGLDAAEALAELGDVRGLDHLIATLNSPSTYLQRQAAQILKRLNHPRGLRALTEHSDQPPGVSPGTQRDHLYDDLNTRTTDELVALWHQQDRSTSSDSAFDVLRQILMERLGSLPSTDSQADREEVDGKANPRIRTLWQDGDVEGLTEILEDDPNVALQLEAAEALAALGQDEALEILIETLDDPDQAAADLAAGILDWLDLPAGNAALRSRGIEFDAAGESPAEKPVSPPLLEPESPLTQAPPVSWVSATPEPPALRPPRAPSLQQASALTVWQQDLAPSARLGSLLIGAAGGALGFLAFRLGAHLVGALPLPSTLQGWLQNSWLYLALSLMVGAALGPVGSRVTQTLATRFGWEPSEGDPLPVIGALIEGAISALVLDLLLFIIIGPGRAN